jgi:hypothetical protein
MKIDNADLAAKIRAEFGGKPAEGEKEVVVTQLDAHEGPSVVIINGQLIAVLGKQAKAIPDAQDARPDLWAAVARHARGMTEGVEQKTP